jgi:hypothetical protein
MPELQNSHKDCLEARIGANGSLVKPEGHGIDYKLKKLDFSIYMILTDALRSWG